MKLEPHRVSGERSARQSRPLDRAFALLDPLLARRALVVESNACTCYHPLFVFNQFGDLERCALRAGNVHSADGWDDVLKPVVARYQGKVSRIYFQRTRREGRPLCYLPDGRGRHRTANVPGYFAAHRGATAAATTSAIVRRSMSCIQEQPTEGVCPNARENGQIRLSTKRSGYPRCW